MKTFAASFATTAIGLATSVTALTCAAVGWSASAMEPQRALADHRLSEHPAVTIKRLSEHQGYDYASKFYPHPAGLRLLPVAPDEMQAHAQDTSSPEAQSQVSDASHVQ